MQRLPGLLLLAAGLGRSAAAIVGVEVRTSHLEFPLHGWAIVNLEKAPDFVCNMSTTARRGSPEWFHGLAAAQQLGAVELSWGEQACGAAGDWSACHLLAESMGKAALLEPEQRARFFAEQNVRYEVCGLSFYSDLFEDGVVQLGMAESGEQLLSLSSVGLESRAVCHPAHRGQQPTRCAFLMGELFIGGGDCSGLEAGYCASLNRLECARLAT